MTKGCSRSGLLSAVRKNLHLQLQSTQFFLFETPRNFFVTNTVWAVYYKMYTAPSVWQIWHSPFHTAAYRRHGTEIDSKARSWSMSDNPLEIKNEVESCADRSSLWHAAHCSAAHCQHCRRPMKGCRWRWWWWLRRSVDRQRRPQHSLSDQLESVRDRHITHSSLHIKFTVRVRMPLPPSKDLSKPYSFHHALETHNAVYRDLRRGQHKRIVPMVTTTTTTTKTTKLCRFARQDTRVYTPPLVCLVTV